MLSLLNAICILFYPDLFQINARLIPVNYGYFPPTMLAVLQPQHGDDLIWALDPMQASAMQASELFEITGKTSSVFLYGIYTRRFIFSS